MKFCLLKKLFTKSTLRKSEKIKGGKLQGAHNLFLGFLAPCNLAPTRVGSGLHEQMLEYYYFLFALICFVLTNQIPNAGVVQQVDSQIAPSLSCYLYYVSVPCPTLKQSNYYSTQKYIK